jgi:hypothetical protein
MIKEEKVAIKEIYGKLKESFNLHSNNFETSTS